MSGYYDERLSAERLRRCYEVAPPRVRRYLDAEIGFVLQHVRSSSKVLELGCGYGRVLRPLAERAGIVVGIDRSLASLRLAGESVGDRARSRLAAMDAAALGFRDRCFDLVVCVQNGISAFHVEARRLVEEAVRVTRSGGTVLFSSYASSFWEDRLEWFRIQADGGLIGEIDESATGDGVIVCTDGFRATTVGHDEFTRLTTGVPGQVDLLEIDGSSLFCVIRIP